MSDRVRKTKVQPPKGQRLRFKRKVLAAEVEEEQKGKQDNQEGHEERKQQQQTTTTDNEANETLNEEKEMEELSEWGPEINGYRFVGVKGKPHHYEKRHWLVTDTASAQGEKNFYNWSYMDVPEYTTADGLDDQYADLHGDLEDEDEGESGLTYGEYFKEWDVIRQEGHRVVIFPLKHTTDDLIKDNVQSFIRTSNDYTRALKMERIRWHPDKMLQTLGIGHDPESLSDVLLVKKITNTFQIINELWEAK